MARLFSDKAFAPILAPGKQKDIQKLSALGIALLETHDQTTEHPAKVSSPSLNA